MRQLVIEIIAATALTFAAIIASATGAHAGDVAVTDAFARASASPAATSAAAYLTIENSGDQADHLLSVTTPAAQSASLHRTVVTGDVVKMEEVSALALPAHGSVQMKPGGLHIMLMGLAAPLRKGDAIEVTLGFEHAPSVTVAVPVGGVAADHAGHGTD